MAKHIYVLAYLPVRFPHTYVLVTSEGEHFAIRDYSENPCRSFDSNDLATTYRDLLAEAADRREVDAHKTDDHFFWWRRIRELNRNRGIEESPPV